MHVVQIFKPGCYIPMSGACLCFSETDLQQTALAYDRRLGKAPLVIGHPADDRPAFGSVYGLVFGNSTLEAIVDGVAPAFAEAVNIGRFKKVSASFYTPTAPANPRPLAGFRLSLLDSHTVPRLTPNGSRIIIERSTTSLHILEFLTWMLPSRRRDTDSTRNLGEQATASQL